MQSWRKWNEGTPLDIIDPTLNIGPRSEIMRCINIGLVCVQENEALRPTMAQVSMMLSNYSVTLAAPSKPAFFLHGETSILPLMNASMLTESDESRTKSPQWSNNEVSISEIDPRWHSKVMGKLLSMLVVQLCFKLSHIIIRFGGSRSCGFCWTWRQMLWCNKKIIKKKDHVRFPDCSIRSFVILLMPYNYCSFLILNSTWNTNSPATS